MRIKHFLSLIIDAIAVQVSLGLRWRLLNMRDYEIKAA